MRRLITFMVESPQSSTRTMSWYRIITYTIVCMGTILNLLFIVPNGDYSCQQGVCGIRIGEWHYHDALWHIAVARNSFQVFPFIFPSAAGFSLTSYNYMLDAILWILEKLWINPLFTYFKLLPVVGNVALIYSLFRYYRLTKKTETERLWITFFMYLGSSFSFLLILYRNDYAGYSILKGFPVIATLQPVFVLSNVQFFLTLPILIYIFTNIVIRLRTRYTVLIHSLLLSLVLGLKIYSGIFVFLILIIGSLSEYISDRKSWETVKTITYYLAVFVLGIMLLFLPFGKYSMGAPFVWSPFAIPHAITESPGLLYNKDFTLGRYYMYGLHRISPRLILYEMMSALIFIVWNLGSRSVFVYGILHNYLTRRINFENVTLFSMGMIGLVIPIVFIQNGGGWYNSIQFAYIGVYFIGILAGVTVAKIWTNKSYVARSLVILIVIMTLPNTILSFKLFAKEKEIIPSQEMKALNFLRNKPRGVVLSFPDNKNSSYVPALAAKVGYMVDYEQSALLGLPTDTMIKAVEDGDCRVLTYVDYVYFHSSKGIEYRSCPNFTTLFRSIYQEGGISIFMK